MARFSTAVAAIALLAAGSVHSFSASVKRCNVVPFTRLSMATLPTAEESAKAFSDYMAKSHEEKIKAVKAAEEKSAAQIESLKKEIAELKSSRESSIVQSSALAAPTPTPPEGSKEELMAKLVAYQKFMAEYIVNAQEQKLAAVKAAEAAAEKKLQEKLLLLGAAPEPSATTASVELAAPSENKLFKDRNAKVSAAAKAGKSRWGDMENQRATGAVSVAPAPASAPAPAAAPVAPVPVDIPVAVPPEVEAADHGLRADGGVGGPSLAQRVTLGASVLAANGVKVDAPPVPVAAEAAPVLSKYQKLFQQRNAMVSAAGKAGKSRWGEMEIAKATEVASKALSVATTLDVGPSVPAAVIEAADHGLRADGGVGGPSLGDRVNLGAQLLQNA